MSDLDEKYCDFCRSTLGDEYVDRGHQEWCPLVEIERLRGHFASCSDELDGERWDNDCKDKEIERLRAALRGVLRVATEADESCDLYKCENAVIDVLKIAKEALGE